jgi:hypothetical protein
VTKVIEGVGRGWDKNLCPADYPEEMRPRGATNIKGARYGKLTVVRFVGLNRHSQALWLCECDCGRYTVAASHNLRTENTTSCGCAQRDAAKRRGLERRKEPVKLDPYRKALLNGLVSLKERMDQQK